MGVLLEFRHGETGKLRLCFFVNVNAPDFFHQAVLRFIRLCLTMPRYMDARANHQN